MTANNTIFFTTENQSTGPRRVTYQHTNDTMIYKASARLRLQLAAVCTLCVCVLLVFSFVLTHPVLANIGCHMAVNTADAYR